MLTHLRRNTEKYDLLTCGYIRENYGTYLPMSLCRTCCEFYTEISFYFFDEYMVKQIRNNYTGCLGGIGPSSKGYNVVNVRGYTFGCSIHRNKLLLWTNHYFTEFLMIYEVYCNELKIGQTGSISQNEDKLTKPGDMILMSLPQLPKDIQSLSFNIYMDFISKKRSTGISQSDNICKDMKLNKTIKYKWDIDDDLADEFMNAKEDAMYFSDNFGNNQEKDIMKQYAFCLQFRPKLKTPHVIGVPVSYKLTLKKIVLPTKVTAIDFILKVSLSDGFKGVDSNVSTQFTTEISLYGEENIASLLQKSRTFSVDIEIIAVYYDDEEIDKSQWKDYGICD